MSQPSRSQPLTGLRVGNQARVVSVEARGAIRQRLFDMGLLPGRCIQLLRVAPASGPLWLRLGASQLSLRRSEAGNVIVEPIP